MKNLIVVVLLCTTSLAYAGFDEGFDAYKKGNYAVALKEFKKVAEKGNASAQFGIGRMYDNGEGVPQSYKQAVVWYTKAAEHGMMAKPLVGLKKRQNKGIRLLNII